MPTREYDAITPPATRRAVAAPGVRLPDLLDRYEPVTSTFGTGIETLRDGRPITDIITMVARTQLAFMGRQRISRRALLATSGVAGAVSLGTYGVSGGLTSHATPLVDLVSGLDDHTEERVNEPPEFGPGERPNAGSGDPVRSTAEVGPDDHDVYVVCHRHELTDPEQYALIVETLRTAADYHSSFREFDIAVVDAGADLPEETPAFDGSAVYEYLNGHHQPYSSRHDVHLLVFDNPWFRVGRASGNVGWGGGREPWSVAVLAAGMAGAHSEAYMRSMALHEVGHALVRSETTDSGQFVDGHEAGGTVHDGGEIREVYPMSSTYVFDGGGNCDVGRLACVHEPNAPDEFVGCSANASGDQFADPLYRNLFWANRRTHDGLQCPTRTPRPDDETPGVTEDEIALTVRQWFR